MVIPGSQPKDDQRAANVPLIALLVVLSEGLGDREVTTFDPDASCFANGLEGQPAELTTR
jgi:hypothetical protein